MSYFSLEDLMRDNYNRGNLDLMVAAIKDKAFWNNSLFFNAQNGMQQQVASMDAKQLFQSVVEQYIKQLIDGFNANKHHGKKSCLYFDSNGSKKEVLQPYSNLDKAIIMTYEKYRNSSEKATPMHVVEACMKDLFFKGDNHFTRSVDDKNVSARTYASQYVEQMSRTTTDWKTAIYIQMIQDICLSYSKQFESERKSQKDSSRSPIFIKRFFPKVFKQIKEKMASGKINGVNRRVNGSIPGMYYASDVGRRGNQEDALLIMEHPSIKGLRIAIVSDGMGGGENGEEASHIAIVEMKQWFEALKIDPDKVDTGTLRMSIAQKIKEISAKIIREKGDKCGATITGAIIGNKDAVVLNVGDSRTYLVKNGALEQVTVDHSNAQKMYESYFKNIYPGMTPDEMRFWKWSNVITRMLGIDVKDSIPDFFHLNAEDFDKLILCSDGVSDCMSYNQISTFAKMYSKEQLAIGLVNAAVDEKNVSRPERVYSQDFDSVIKGGKDNTTAVVVDR